jgi:hypothetical protein
MLTWVESCCQKTEMMHTIHDDNGGSYSVPQLLCLWRTACFEGIICVAYQDDAIAARLFMLFCLQC